LGIVA